MNERKQIESKLADMRIELRVKIREGKRITKDILAHEQRLGRVIESNKSRCNEIYEDCSGKRKKALRIFIANNNLSGSRVACEQAGVTKSMRNNQTIRKAWRENFWDHYRHHNCDLKNLLNHPPLFY